LSELAADVIVVGGGPSAVHAAAKAVQLGLGVVLVHPAIEDTSLEESVPPKPFSELRRSDESQARYFLGDDLRERLREPVKVGSQLTPPRQYVLRDADRHLPIDSTSFRPLQTLALGGLGAAWGGGTHTYEDFELAEAGIPAPALQRHYEDVAREIGISGAKKDDTAAHLLAVEAVQPPLELDSNGATIFSAYGRKREALHARGFRLGRPPVAILTEALSADGLERHPNPMFDMDFYTNYGRSIYRPAYTLSTLERCGNFRQIKNALAVNFDESQGRVDLTYLDLATGRRSVVSASRLILAAGALNSARLVLRSRGLYGVRVPLLSNAYQYIATVNRHMFGRPAADRRHSSSQLVGTLTLENGDRLLAAFFSYRSLLLYRLVKEMPTHPRLGLLAARLLQTSFTIVGLHHPERFSAGKWLALRRVDSETDTLTGQYEPTADEQRAVAENISRMKACLWTLGCMPLSVIDPAPGASIHYAGTLAANQPSDNPAGTSPDGRLNLSRSVYVADSSPWTFLPAKGLTLTLMANARRVAEAACAQLNGA
jgi:hypothetical protein